MSGPGRSLWRAMMGASVSRSAASSSAGGTGMGCTWLRVGQFDTQVPQPVHLFSSTKRGCRFSCTAKLPGSPWTLSTWLSVRISMSRWRPISTSRGAMVHMAQSLVGKVLSSCDITPPTAGLVSVTYTLIPAAARSSAACIPPMPPPTTSAAPTGPFCTCSTGIAQGLLCGRRLHRPVAHRLQV